MHSEARIALVMVAIALAAIPGWMAGRLVTANLRVLSHWRKLPARVVGLAEASAVTLELGSEPDGPRIRVPVRHQLGLSFLKQVTAYVDPADERNVRTGGLLQMWSWPAALAIAAIVMLAFAASAARLGGGVPVSPQESHGRWMFSPPPAPMTTEIRVHRPASEGRAPLLWALLGLALIVISVFAEDQSEASRTCAGAAGLLFVLLMAGLAWNNRSTEVSADATGLRKATAFGWSQVRWEEVGSVTRERTVFGRSSSSLRTRNDSFPGREVTQIVFADRAGRRLLTMSPSMQPRETMGRLLDLCAQRTGLHIEFRTECQAVGHLVAGQAGCQPAADAILPHGGADWQSAPGWHPGSRAQRGASGLQPAAAGVSARRGSAGPAHPPTQAYWGASRSRSSPSPPRRRGAASRTGRSHTRADPTASPA